MKTVWEKLDEKGINVCNTFAADYEAFLSASKTEREFTRNAVKAAEDAGFKKLSDVEELKAGDRVYAVNRGKNVCLFVIGTEDTRKGMNILGAHIDSPRMDLKQHPLYEANGLALLDTHYYGGIKKYQWVARPMAIHGVVCKKDGTTVDVVIGEDDNDPVVGVTDLLIHLARQQMTKTGNEIVPGEKLDLLVGSVPAKKEDDKDTDLVKKTILNLLQEKYGIEEDDFLSAELEVVPAGKARDYGLDRSMIMGYGHDDKVCAYTSMRAILDAPAPQRTSCCILVDKEEIGSVGATGMHSRFFEYTVTELLAKLGYPSVLDLQHTLTNSKMLSSDVSAAFDPLYPEVMDPKNSVYLGGGICFNKFTGSGGKGGSNDANPEFIAEVRKVMDDADVSFQTAELGGVDVGGGGTIAYILANLNMEVMDAGIAVLNMHSPSEVVSKADVYETYRGYMAFLKGIE